MMRSGHLRRGRINGTQGTRGEGGRDGAAGNSPPALRFIPTRRTAGGT